MATRVRTLISELVSEGYLPKHLAIVLRQLLRELNRVTLLDINDHPLSISCGNTRKPNENDSSANSCTRGGDGTTSALIGRESYNSTREGLVSDEDEDEEQYQYNEQDHDQVSVSRNYSEDDHKQAAAQICQKQDLDKEIVDATSDQIDECDNDMRYRSRDHSLFLAQERMLPVLGDAITEVVLLLELLRFLHNLVRKNPTISGGETTNSASSSNGPPLPASSAIGAGATGSTTSTIGGAKNVAGAFTTSSVTASGPAPPRVPPTTHYLAPHDAHWMQARCTRKLLTQAVPLLEAVGRLFLAILDAAGRKSKARVTSSDVATSTSASIARGKTTEKTQDEVLKFLAEEAIRALHRGRAVAPNLTTQPSGAGGLTSVSCYADAVFDGAENAVIEQLQLGLVIQQRKIFESGSPCCSDLLHVVALCGAASSPDADFKRKNWLGDQSSSTPTALRGADKSKKDQQTSQTNTKLKSGTTAPIILPPFLPEALMLDRRMVAGRQQTQPPTRMKHDLRQYGADQNEKFGSRALEADDAVLSVLQRDQEQELDQDQQDPPSTEAGAERDHVDSCSTFYKIRRSRIVDQILNSLLGKFCAHSRQHENINSCDKSESRLRDLSLHRPFLQLCLILGDVGYISERSVQFQTPAQADPYLFSLPLVSSDYMAMINAHAAAAYPRKSAASKRKSTTHEPIPGSEGKGKPVNGRDQHKGDNHDVKSRGPINYKATVPVAVAQMTGSSSSGIPHSKHATGTATATILGASGSVNASTSLIPPALFDPTQAVGAERCPADALEYSSGGVSATANCVIGFRHAASVSALFALVLAAQVSQDRERFSSFIAQSSSTSASGAGAGAAGGSEGASAGGVIPNAMSSSSAIKVDTTLSGAGGMTGTAGTDPVRQGIAAPVAKLASMPVQHNNIDRKSKLQLQMLRRKQVSSAKTSARRQSYDHDSETTSGGNGVSRYNCSFHVDFNDAHDVVLGPHESREKHQEDEDALSVSTIDDSDASYLDGRHDHKSAQLRDALPAPSSRADRGLEDVVHGSSISNISTKQEARSTGPSTMTSATAAPKPFDADVLRKERRDAAGFSVPWVNLLPPAGPDKSLELSTLEQHYSLQVLAHRCPILMAIVRHFVSGEVHLQKGEVVHTSSCEHQNYEIAGGGKYADTGNLRKNNAGAKSGRVVPEHQQHNRKVNNASGGILDNRGREEQIKIDNKNQERMVLMKRSIVFDSPLFRVWRGTVDRALQDRMAFGNIFGASIPPFYFWHVGNVRSLPISGKWICSSTVLEGASAGAAAASAMGLLTLPKKESFACDNQSVARLGHSGFSNATLRGVGEDSLEHGLFLLLDGGVDEYNTYAREADSLYGANNSSASGGGTYGDVARAGLRGELELLMPGNIAHQQEKASQQHKTIENLAGRILYTQQQFRETRRRRVITCNTNLRSDAFFRLERLKQRLGSEKQRIQELQYELDRVENLESSYTSRRPPHAARIDHQVVVDHVHDEDEHEESSSDQLSESSSSSDSTVFSHSPHSTSTVSMNDDFEDREEREIRKHEDKNKSCCSEHEKYRQEKSSTSPSSGPLLNIISMSTSTATTSYMLSSSMQGLEKQDQDGSYVQEIRDLLFQVGHWEQCEGQTRELIHGAEHRLLQQEARFRDRLRERDAYYALLEQHWRAQLEQLLKEQLLAEREEMLSLCHQQLGIVVPEEDKLNFYGGSVRGINEERAAFRCHLRDREQYLLVVEKRKLLEAVHDTVDQLSEDYRTHAECLDEKKAELEQLQNYMRKLRERHDLINECVALEQKDYTASGGSDRIVMDVEA